MGVLEQLVIFRGGSGHVGIHRKASLLEGKLSMQMALRKNYCDAKPLCHAHFKLILFDPIYTEVNKKYYSQQIKLSELMIYMDIGKDAIK